MPILPKPPGTVIYPVRPGMFIVADFYMPVGTTGITFVAALQGLSSAAGPTIFAQTDQDAALVRAASTLSHWGIIDGQFFAFIRQALKMSQADAAAFIGVTVPSVQAWEAGTTDIPRDMWIMLADEIGRVDSRPGLVDLALTPDKRARLIRIFPDVPQKSDQVPFSPPC